MSDKLNSSLDDILKAQPRSSARRGRGNRRAGPGRRATEAPVGGVAKTTRQTKPNKAAPAAPAGLSGGETKIMISNLVCHFPSDLIVTNLWQPFDVEENQLKVCKTVEGL